MLRHVTLLIALGCLSLCVMLHAENNRKREKLAFLPPFSLEKTQVEENKLAELTRIYEASPTPEAQASMEAQREVYHQMLRTLTLQSALEKSERITPWFYGITGVLCVLTTLLFTGQRRVKDSAPER